MNKVQNINTFFLHTVDLKSTHRILVRTEDMSAPFVDEDFISRVISEDMFAYIQD